jgi:hypothetical protein
MVHCGLPIIEDGVGGAAEDQWHLQPITAGCEARAGLRCQHQISDVALLLYVLLTPTAEVCKSYKTKVIDEYGTFEPLVQIYLASLPVPKSQIGRWIRL